MSAPFNNKQKLNYIFLSLYFLSELLKTAIEENHQQNVYLYNSAYVNLQPEPNVNLQENLNNNLSLPPTNKPRKKSNHTSASNSMPSL